MVRIILVRHGETKWNIEGRYQGQEDTDLSERGLEQGRLLAQGLKGVPIDVFVSSPLKRSFMTASFCAELHGNTVAKDERLTAYGKAGWQGTSRPSIPKSLPHGTRSPIRCKCPEKAANLWKT